MDNKITKQTVSKNHIPQIVSEIDGNCTNGEIFGACRNIQDGALEENVEITNLSEVYFWIKEIRDKKRDG